MGKNSKHTQGAAKIFFNPYAMVGVQNYQIADCFSNLLNEETITANAERIVTAWNNWDMATDLLSEFVKMQNDPGYGDLVWRLAIKEKAEALLNSTKP